MQRAKIHLLPPELRNQIAAGEVVERPASVVKELVENALDAHATEISVTMEDGGQSLISVQDNGTGIPADELELAVTRHATSKLQNAGDLSRILSYGFRGEALPSIASVSRFRIVSKIKDDPIAHELYVNFGDIKTQAPSALRQGTLIEVSDLFFNIPARLKFLKNPATELKRAAELFVRLALAADGVSMRLEAGSRILHEFFAHEDKKAKLAKIWSSSVIDELAEVKTEACGMKVYGYISNPRSVQPRADRMLLYVNGRAVSDKLLLKAVRQAYAGKITTRDYPQCLLFLEIDPQEVDVNVHPAKSEVRFRDERAIFSLMAKAVDNALSSSYFSVRDLQSGVQDGKGDGERDGKTENSPLSQIGLSQAKFGDLYQESAAPKPQGFWGNADKETRLSFAREDKTAVAEDVVEYFQSSKTSCGSAREFTAERLLNSDSSDIYTRQSLREPAQAIEPLQMPDYQDYQTKRAETLHADNSSKGDIKQEKPFFGGAVLPINSENRDRQEKNARERTAETAVLPCGLDYLGQVAETYLIVRKDGNTLLLLDQHAIHERILYEETKKGQIQSQALLCSLELPLHASELLRFGEVRETLQKLGFVISETKRDGQSVLEISAIPARYDRVTAMGFLKEILAEKMDDLDGIWVRHACKSAVKAHTPLDRASAARLILQWLETSEPDNCPHGRPCVVHFDETDLEKLFKRKF